MCQGRHEEVQEKGHKRTNKIKQEIKECNKMDKSIEVGSRFVLPGLVLSTCLTWTHNPPVSVGRDTGRTRGEVHLTILFKFQNCPLISTLLCQCFITNKTLYTLEQNTDRLQSSQQQYM